MKKDEQFYNRESTIYSEKRYPDVAGNFIQFFFKKRLDIVLQKVGEALNDPQGRSILEIGCADGVVISTLFRKFSDKIVSAKGIDSSPGMIAVAQKKHMPLPIKFYVRDDSGNPAGLFDIILEIGVINYLKIENELNYVIKSLSTEGIYICSISGQSSLLNLLRPYGESFEHQYSYKDYEHLLTKYFSIQEIIPVGLFIPFLWRLPFAGYIQENFERMLRPVLPSIFLEKIYILRPIR